nr:LysR family transcriptional regulator [uncultured Ligilactobacillus sp.]
MHKVLLVMHDVKFEDYYRMNKIEFEIMPEVGQYIYNTDGLVYEVEAITQFAGYVSEKGAVAVIVVHPVAKDEPVSNLYNLNIEEDIDD